MHPRRVAAIVLRQFYLIRGSPARVLPLFAWVCIDIVLWGFISRYLDTVATPGHSMVPTLLGAVLLWDFLTRVMYGVTMAFLEDVWSRNFLNFFASPLRVPEYVAGLVLSSVATSTVGLLVMLVLASLCFGLSFLGFGVVLVPLLLTLFLSGIALGIFGAAIVLRYGPAAEWFIWPMPALVSPFAGVFYPLSTLPSAMRAVSRLLPPSYVFEAVRALVSGRPVAWSDMAIGVGLALAQLLLAGWFFLWIYSYVVRSGLIARYTAEGVT